MLIIQKYFSGTGLTYTPAAADLGVGVELPGSGNPFQGYLQAVEYWTSMPAHLGLLMKVI